MSANTIAPIPRKAEFTPQDIMKMESFRHLTEAQAAGLLETIDAFCDIAYSIWAKQQPQPNQSCTIALPPPQQLRMAA